MKTMGKVIGKRTTRKGKLDPTRWGWKAVSFFDGQEKNVCIPTFGHGIFRKHLYAKRKIVFQGDLVRLASNVSGAEVFQKAICRRCGRMK